MHTNTISKWQHTHIFGQDQIRSGEKRTLIVVILTGLMMVVEVLVGIFFGSMALLADGIHMGTHMVGLLIALIAYRYARKYAKDRSFSFGTGKVNSLAGYTSAVLLILFALLMGWESFERFINPVEIGFNVAITVAVIGLVVNGASMWILGEHGHSHDHGGHDHHGHDHHGHDHHDHAEENAHNGTEMDKDHNLKAAYLHVLMDALTSVFAIFALLAAKYFGWIWADPFMGVVGAVLVARWSIILVRVSSKVLLDYQMDDEVTNKVKGILESYKDTKVTDFHLWSIGPGIFSANLTVVTQYPDPPDKYKSMIPSNLGVVHTTVEVHQCED